MDNIIKITISSKSKSKSDNLYIVKKLYPKFRISKELCKQFRIFFYASAKNYSGYYVRGFKNAIQLLRWMEYKEPRKTKI